MKLAARVSTLPPGFRASPLILPYSCQMHPDPRVSASCAALHPLSAGQSSPSTGHVTPLEAAMPQLVPFGGAHVSAHVSAHAVPVAFSPLKQRAAAPSDAGLRFENGSVVMVLYGKTVYPGKVYLTRWLSSFFPSFLPSC